MPILINQKSRKVPFNGWKHGNMGRCAIIYSKSGHANKYLVTDGSKPKLGYSKHGGSNRQYHFQR